MLHCSFAKQAFLKAIWTSDCPLIFRKFLFLIPLDPLRAGIIAMTLFFPLNENLFRSHHITNKLFNQVLSLTNNKKDGFIMKPHPTYSKETEKFRKKLENFLKKIKRSSYNQKGFYQNYQQNY